MQQYTAYSLFSTMFPSSFLSDREKKSTPPAASAINMAATHHKTEDFEKTAAAVCCFAATTRSGASPTISLMGGSSTATSTSAAAGAFSFVCLGALVSFTGGAIALAAIAAPGVGVRTRYSLPDLFKELPSDAVT